MDIKFLGSGTYFAKTGLNNNILISSHGANILIDCGNDIKMSMARAGLWYPDIDSIYISHCHGDHIGGLEGFCHWNYHVMNKRRIKLYGDVEVLDLVWQSLKAAARGIQGKVVDLEDYFDVIKMDVNEKYFDPATGLNLETVQAIHIANGHGYVPNFGLMFGEDDGNTVYYTSDTMFAPDTIRDFYKQADLIIQDVEFGHRSIVHSHGDDLATLPGDIKSKMILCHAPDTVLDTPRCECCGQVDFDKVKINETYEKWVKDNGFRDIASPGQVFSIK